MIVIVCYCPVSDNNNISYVSDDPHCTIVSPILGISHDDNIRENQVRTTSRTWPLPWLWRAATKWRRARVGFGFAPSASAGGSQKLGGWSPIDWFEIRQNPMVKPGRSSMFKFTINKSTLNSHLEVVLVHFRGAIPMAMAPKGSAVQVTDLSTGGCGRFDHQISLSPLDRMAAFILLEKLWVKRCHFCQPWLGMCFC